MTASLFFNASKRKSERSESELGTRGWGRAGERSEPNEKPCEVSRFALASNSLAVMFDPRVQRSNKNTTK